MENEIWKRLKEPFQRYEISNMGRARNNKKVLKPLVLSTGYYCYGLQGPYGRKTFLIHRLVALYFLKQKKGAFQVNHKDGDKSNNKAENLEFLTSTENLMHSREKLGFCPIIAFDYEGVLFNGQRDVSVYPSLRFFCEKKGFNYDRVLYRFRKGDIVESYKIKRISKAVYQRILKLTEVEKMSAYQAYQQVMKEKNTPITTALEKRERRKEYAEQSLPFVP